MTILNYSCGCTWVPRNREPLPAVVRDRYGGRGSERFDIAGFEDGERMLEEFGRPGSLGKARMGLWWL